MIEITNGNCPSYKLHCGEKSGTGFVIAENRILTARHVVLGADKKATSAWINVPDQGKVDLRICDLNGNPAVTDSLVLLAPANPQQQLPKSLPLYRPVAAPKQDTGMKAYGYLGKKNGQNGYPLIEYDIYRPDEPSEHGEVRNAQFKINQSPDHAGGLSGSPIFCEDRLFGVLNTEDYVNRKVDFVYGFCGDEFFKELAAFGIPLPASPTPPELPKAAFELPEQYQARMAEQLKAMMKKQSACRKDGRQPPIFLRGPDGIGKLEFFWEFAEQYREGYVYHLNFINNFQVTLNRDQSGIIERKHADTAEKQLKLLRECSESDILIITGADFAKGYLAKNIEPNDAYKELCKLPLHLVIATRQPIPENLGDCKPLELELKPLETELVEWSIGKLSSLGSDNARMLVKQAEHNPLLIHRIMDILVADPDLTPAGMVEALQNPSKSNANLYLDMKEPYNLFTLLDAKIPHPKGEIKDDEIYRSILMLILGELIIALPAQGAADVSDDADEYLTAEEFEAWVHSTDSEDKEDSEDKKKVPDAFEKLRRIGMIERSPMGCYSIPIIPRLLLRKEKHELNWSIAIDYQKYRARALKARVRFESADPETEVVVAISKELSAAEEHWQKAEHLLNALVQACADPYDSFSVFCASNKQELETYLPELFAFGQYINQAFVRCGLGVDPMEPLHEAETLLAQLCQDAQSQRTILAAKLYDTFRSALYMHNHSEDANSGAYCDALVSLFEAELTLRPKFIPCLAMKSQVYWCFGKEDEAYQAAEEVSNRADCPQDHYCADACMILGKYLENRADELLDRDVAKCGEYYAQACEQYHQALEIRSGARKKNLQQNRQDLSRLIQCYGKWCLIEPQRWKHSGGSSWVWNYGRRLLETDLEIFADCEIDSDFIADSELLLTLCLAAEKGIGADADSSDVKNISGMKLKILKYILERYPTEEAKNRIVACEDYLTKRTECQVDPGVPDASNG